MRSCPNERPIEQYINSKLEFPIIIKPNRKFYCMTFAGFGFLLFGSYVAAFNPSAQELDYYERAMGIIGLFVFGFSFILTVIAIFRSWKRGLLTISRDGIHIAHYGTTFHWRHVSPAWINEVGDKNSKNVCFILACSDSYKAMSRIGKVLNWISDIKQLMI